jgi:hypothetical protein
VENESNFEKLLKNIEKEVMKKEEYFMLFQFYEKAKKVLSFFFTF